MLNDTGTSILVKVKDMGVWAVLAIGTQGCTHDGPTLGGSLGVVLNLF